MEVISMKLNYVQHWEYNLCDTFKSFIEYNNLQSELCIVYKDSVQEMLNKPVNITKDNIINLMEQVYCNEWDDETEFLNKMAAQYIIENDLFDCIFTIEEDGNNIYYITISRIVPTSQENLKRFMEKHLQAYKDGFGEVVDEVINKKLNGGN
jgi:protein associated with RNAse G/E